MTAISGLPFDDVRQLLSDLPEPDARAAAAARTRDATLTKPAGSLGRLEDIAAWIAAWQGKERPTVERPLVAVFAANHGIAARGVSAYPQSVTAQMVANFSAGGAAINQLCKANGLALKIYELALDHPTPDIVVGGCLRRKILRRDDRLRHGGGGGRGRSPLPRRNGDRQHDGGGGDLPRALRRCRRGLGRARDRGRR